MFTLVLFITLIALTLSMPSKYDSNYEGNDNIDYFYRFKILDDNTYNYQFKTEKKIGNDIKGLYSVVEPTGDLRMVKYLADDSGFHVHVKTAFGKNFPDGVNSETDQEILFKKFVDELATASDRLGY